MAREDLRLTLRDRSSIFWIFLAPFLWVWFFGFLARPADPSGRQVSLTVFQEDVSAAAERMIELMKGAGLKLAVVPPAGERPAKAPARSITIPAGFGESIAARRKVTLPFSQGRDANPEGTIAVEVAVHKASVRLLAEEAFGTLDPAEDAVKLESSWATDRPRPSGAYQTIPGNLVMFVLLSAMTYGAGLLATERRAGILRRIAVSPAGRTDIVLGKLAGRAAVAAVQVSVFVVIGLTVFRIDWGGAPAGLALLLVCLILCAASLGLLAGALFTSGDAASGAGVVATMVMSAMGGCWWPSEVMPGWMRTAAYAFPTAWAMNGLHTLISWGGRTPEVLPHCAVLGLIALAATLAAVRRLDPAR